MQDERTDGMFGSTVRGLHLTVMFQWRTYTRFLYLLIGIPAGVIYWWIIFAVLPITVILTPFGIGVPLLTYTLNGVWILLGIERELSVILLRDEMPVVRQPEIKHSGFTGELRAYIKGRPTWNALLFLLARLPLSLLSVATLAVAIGLASTMAAAPITIFITNIDLGIWNIDAFWEGVIIFPFGLVAGICALYLVDYVAGAYARLNHFSFLSLNKFD